MRKMWAAVANLDFSLAPELRAHAPRPFLMEFIARGERKMRRFVDLALRIKILLRVTDLVAAERWRAAHLKRNLDNAAAVLSQ